MGSNPKEIPMFLGTNKIMDVLPYKTYLRRTADLMFLGLNVRPT